LTEFLLGCAWQRCTVHFLRDCLGHARKDQHGLLGALIRPIFNCDSLAQARDRLSEAVAHLDGRLGKVATMLKDAEPEILAFYVFPAGHWRKLRSNESARALQQGDRAAHRRRRHPPQRPEPSSSRRHALHRAER
jgi:putative transposase